AGWVTLGCFAFSIVAVAVGRPVTGSFIAEDTYSSAAQAAYKVITRGLLVQGLIFCVLGLAVGLLAGWIDRNGGWAAATAAMRRGRAWVRDEMPKKAAPAPVPAMVVATDVGDGARSAAAQEISPGAWAGVVASGVLAPRLPEPKRRARRAHWWRAAALLVV